jgi:kynurenine formamidase
MTQAADTSPKHLSRDEFAELMHRLRGSAGWDATDRRGALNHLTPAHRIAAAAEVRLGQHVTLARPIETESAADNPEPPRHDMTGAVGDHHLDHGVDFAMDRFSMNVHGNATSHIDALCHVIWDSKLYNDVPVDVVTPEGATSLSIEVIRDGIVGRGVLLDIPRLRGTPWLEPGDDVTIDELRDAEQAQGVRVGPGDLLFVRVGHGARREQLGAWDAANARAGLHPTALEFVAERKVAALGSDGNNDTAPSAVDGVDFPVHALAMNALGLHLMDYLQFEDLAPMCETQGRWTFLAVVAPLRLPHATGSPVNPIAIL